MSVVLCALWFLHGHDRFRTASVQARVRIDQPGSIFPPVVDERSLARFLRKHHRLEFGLYLRSFPSLQFFFDPLPLYLS